MNGFLKLIYRFLRHSLCDINRDDWHPIVQYYDAFLACIDPLIGPSCD